MSLWTRLFGSTQKPEQRHTLTDVDFWRDIGWLSAVASGVTVTPETALAVPDVYACVTVLADDVGRCPLKLRVRQDDGEWQDAYSHRLWEILHDLPNPEMTASEFRSHMTRSLLAHEVAYAEIVRNSRGEVMSLWPLDPTRMTVRRDELNRKHYTYRISEGKTATWTFDPDKPPLLEMRHTSPIHRCRDLIGMAIALDKYASKFFANGARMSGVVTSKSGITAAQKAELSEMFRNLYSGVENSHRTGVMQGDLEYKQLSSPNNESQFDETRKRVRTMVAGSFRVPPHKIGDLERATFSNIEAQDRDYVNSGLDPILVLWEQSIRRDVLTTRQYPKYQAIFDREALIQADSQSRMSSMAIGRQNGIFSVNDVRRKLNENPVPAAEGGDLYHMNGNMIPLTGAPEPTEAQAGQPQMGANDPDDVMGQVN
jgi:HK97 family phage portal protein